MVDDADNVYFKRLLDMVPAHLYFNKETKEKIRNQENEGEKSGKKRRSDPFSHQGVSTLQTALNAMEEKIKAKKNSKQKKKKKNAEKGKTGPGINIQEAQEKLRARIAELQAKRRQGLSSLEQQEQKRLERKQRSLNSRNRKKNKPSKNPTDSGVTANSASPVTITKPSKPILNKEGKMVFSKFDFKQTEEKEKHSSLVGKDYKRLLARLEQREAKVAKVKEVNPDAAARLEEKHVWQDVLSKAKGEKVKDDPALLKKAVKRKEKLKSLRKKNWDNRQKGVETQQKKRQEKREKNIQKRKDDKKTKQRKKLIKKGRILPGF